MALTPRSYPQILGQITAAYLSRLGLPSMPAGDPLLSLFEAAAQSDLRNTQDRFNALRDIALRFATGQKLLDIGADENVPMLGATSATGTVSIGDSSFTKIASVIYRGLLAPVSGSTVIAVDDASAFPSGTFSVYLGRGTSNYEGPLTVTSKTNAGPYWTLNLSTPTSRFHALGEGVIVAQGGTRLVPASTVVRTSVGNSTTSVQFATQFSATLPDGENLITGVPVACRSIGTIGNVPSGAIREFVSVPFSGATVTNPTKFSTGLEVETEDHYRDRIRLARASRAKGTDTAITFNVTGAVSSDNKRILSASMYHPAGEPSTLYIDDGTGYEETWEGIATETLVESAVGGEQFFDLLNRPVQKAQVTTTISSPFELTDGNQLAVVVGGVATTHSFSKDSFRSIGNASAEEVAASINGNSSLLWGARVSNLGATVSIFAKADSPEALQVVSPAGTDANVSLGFSTAVSQTIWLYKNDVLLNKDGATASIVTVSKTLWSSISSGATLGLVVDGVPVSVTFNDIDFIGTGYVSVSAGNSLAAWATVFNKKVPGVTATVTGSTLVLTSNRGRSSLASLSVVSGTVSGIFATLSATGSDLQYYFNRNTASVKLVSPLVAGDKLAAGTISTRGFVATPSFATTIVPASSTTRNAITGAEVWIAVDGITSLISVGVAAGSTIAASNSTITGLAITNYLATYTVTGAFVNVQAGDWLIVTDSSAPTAQQGLFRIHSATIDTVSFEMAAAPTGFTLATAGLFVVRSTVEPQRLIVANATYTPSSMATFINNMGSADNLHGAFAQAVGSKCRLVTSSQVGSLAIVAGNPAGLALWGLASTVSSASHFASASSASQIGTPSFYWYETNSNSNLFLTPVSGAAPSSGGIVVGLDPANSLTASASTGVLIGANTGHVSTLLTVSGTGLITVRVPAVKTWYDSDRYFVASPYQLTARDSIGIVVDSDEVSKRFVFNTYRKVAPSTTTYGSSNIFLDADNGGASLATAFGTSFDWADFAVHMKARVLAEGILWRYYRHGADGNGTRLEYVYPTTASQEATVSSFSRSAGAPYVSITLASGAARSLTTRSSSYVGFRPVSGPDANSLYTWLFVFNLPVTSGSRTIRINYTSRGSAAFTGAVSSTSGGSATVVSDSNAGGSPAASGFITVTSPTGTFSVGDALTGGGSATAASSTYGYSVFTPTLPSGITDHGLQVGDWFWIQSTDGNFPTGSRGISARTATTISFVDTLPLTSTFAGTATISKDNAGEVTLSGTSATVGDVFRFGSGSTAIGGKTKTLTNNNLTFQHPLPGVGGTLIWSQGTLSAFPLAANATSTIVAAVNATVNTPVTGYEVTPGNITWASYEAPPNGLGGATLAYSLSDGLNWVQSYDSGTGAMVFKDSPSAGLATGSDWIDEDVRLVPSTAKNVADYFRSQAVSGLFNSAEVVANRNNVQVSSLTMGGSGSVVVDAGSANSASDVAIGTSFSGITYGAISITNASSNGLTAGGWVKLQNSTTQPKNIITSTTTATITSGGTITLDTSAWKWSGGIASAASTGLTVNIENHGRFAAYVFSGTVTGIASVKEGDYMYVTGTVKSSNSGWFQVVRVNSALNTVWVVNPLVVRETCVATNVSFLDYNSTVPGDVLHIGTSSWGSVGNFAVTGINWANQYQFYVAPAGLVNASGPALGTAYGLVSVQGSPLTLYKNILSVCPNGTNTDIWVTTPDLMGLTGAQYGTSVTALDKLNFTALSSGMDGYLHSTGLIQEANRVVYGDEFDPATYPGVAAAGDNINIHSPIVRRLTLALNLRCSGLPDDVASAVKGAVAGIVNSSPNGQFIAISKIVAEAQRVTGVSAVSVSSPSYTVVNDVINVPAYEKALILDPSTDISLTFTSN
jgi:hypothetical protein